MKRRRLTAAHGNGRHGHGAYARAKRGLGRVLKRAARWRRGAGFGGAEWTVVALLGATVVMMCMALTVIPGSVLVVVPVGILALAAQLLWAKDFLKKCPSSHAGWAAHHSHGA